VFRQRSAQFAQQDGYLLVFLAAQPCIPTLAQAQARWARTKLNS
jgi:hypothetical protein